MNIIIFLVLNTVSFSQNTFCITKKDGNTEYNNYFNFVIETNNEFYVIYSRSKFTNISNIKGYSSILKLSKTGRILSEWKKINSDTTSFIYDLIIKDNKIFAFTGEGNNTFTIWELDTSFNEINKKTYKFSDYNNRKIFYFKSNYNYNYTNFFITGSLYDTIYNTPKEGFILKFSANGDSLDTKIINRNIQKENSHISIQSQCSFFTKDSVIFSSVENELEHYIYIINNNMEIVDSSSVSIIGEYGKDMANGEAEMLSDDTIVYACDYQDDIYKTRLSTWDVNFIKLNEVFVDKQDSAIYGSSRNLEISKDGNIFLGQKLFPSSDPFPGPFSTWMVLSKFDKELNLIWQKYYGGDCFYKLISITATKDGGCLLSGDKWLYNTDNSVIAYLLKVDKFGNGPASLIERQGKIKTHELILYPNPSKSNLNIRTAVQRIGGEFKMYDISGKQVLQQKITQSITQINTNNLPAGAYIYKYIHKNKVIESGKWIKE